MTLLSIPGQLFAMILLSPLPSTSYSYIKAVSRDPTKVPQICGVPHFQLSSTKLVVGLHISVLHGPGLGPRAGPARSPWAGPGQVSIIVCGPGRVANILFPNDISIAPPTMSVIRIRACVTARSCIRRYQATWGY